MAVDLSGCAALVTGAASGIGRASAVAFAPAGASVALVESTPAVSRTPRPPSGAGPRAEVIVADVTDLAEVTAAIGGAVEMFGRLDAAQTTPASPGRTAAGEYGEEDFMRVLQVDLAGVWRCMRAEIRHMRAQRSGAIVNTSSMLGAAAMPDMAGTSPPSRCPWPDPRGGARTRRHGIRVNALAPGVTRTGMTSAVSDELLRSVPLGRIAEPEEIAAAVVWLCSPEASYVTGSVLVADGGWLAGKVAGERRRP